MVGTDPAPRVLVPSWQAPADLEPPDVTYSAPRTFTAPDRSEVAATPLAETTTALVVARRDAPVFHDVELTRLTLLPDIVTAMVDRVAALRAGAGS